MTDKVPPPRDDADEPTVATPAAAPASAPPPRVTAWSRVRSRRVPLLVAAAALLAGCVLGAGVVAAGAAVSHFGDRGDQGNSRFDGDLDRDRLPGPGWDGWPGRRPEGGPGGRVPGPPPSSVAPAPSSSAAKPAPTISS